jgi:phosphatidylinositol-specific phospholipase C-like protein
MAGNDPIIQAGGGTSPVVQRAHSAIETFEPNVLGSLRRIFEKADHQRFKDFAGFLKYMGSADSNAILPLQPANLDLPLSSYFISSSHNTYLVGNQLYGSATVDGYKNVIEAASL